jgi:hypothetical protein
VRCRIKLPISPTRVLSGTGPSIPPPNAPITLSVLVLARGYRSVRAVRGSSSGTAPPAFGYAPSTEEQRRPRVQLAVRTPVCSNARRRRQTRPRWRQTAHRSPIAAMRSAPQRDLLPQNEVRRFRWVHNLRMIGRCLSSGLPTSGALRTAMTVSAGRKVKDRRRAVVNAPAARAWASAVA